MPMPFAPPIILSHNARTELQALVRASSTPQSLSLRARIVLQAAATAPPTNLHIGRALGCCNHTVGKWRRRYLALGFAGLQDALRPGRPRTIASATRVQVISVASTLPHDQERTVTRWTLDEIVATLLDALHTDPISRSSIWRILHDIDLKPHKSEYWLNSHDADFDAKAHTICQLYAHAIEAHPPWYAGADPFFGRGHGPHRLDPWDHPEGHRFRGASPAGVSDLAPHGTV